MKTKEYIKKYNLDIQSKFNHNDFINDLTVDFISQLEFHTSTFQGLTLVKYQILVKQIREKWNNISLKSKEALPDKLWNYFYATVIAKVKEEYFKDYFAKIKREKEEKKKFWAQFNNGYDSFFDNFFHNFWKERISSLLSGNNIDNYLSTLGFDKIPVLDDLNKKYRELVMQHHPDKGGNSEMFQKITEAKNYILRYIKK
jgi:hypothetical protein